MSIESFNIVGITGGIGYHFFRLVKEGSPYIHGYYHSNDSIALRIKEEYSNIVLNKVDFSSVLDVHEIKLSNCEGLLYVAGRPHFGQNIFDFEEFDLYDRINIDICSLFLILQRLCTQNDTLLRKVVVVCSHIPNEITSLYHMIKHLQSEFLLKIRYILNTKGIGLSVVKVGWVNTNMYKEYLRVGGNKSRDVLSPTKVAEVCLQEFENEEIFHLRMVQ